MFVFINTQCDQAKEGLVNNSAQMDEYCKDKGFIGWFETSAKENINIDESARFLVTAVRSDDFTSVCILTLIHTVAVFVMFPDS